MFVLEQGFELTLLIIFILATLRGVHSLSAYPYLHCDLIGQECLTTITMTISINVINHHQEKIQS